MSFVTDLLHVLSSTRRPPCSNTALFYADEGEPEMVSLCMDLGSDPAHTNADGQTAVEYWLSGGSESDGDDGASGDDENPFVAELTAWIDEAGVRASAGKLLREGLVGCRLPHFELTRFRDRRCFRAAFVRACGEANPAVAARILRLHANVMDRQSVVELPVDDDGNSVVDQGIEVRLALLCDADHAQKLNPQCRFTTASNGAIRVGRRRRDRAVGSVGRGFGSTCR